MKHLIQLTAAVLLSSIAFDGSTEIEAASNKRVELYDIHDFCGSKWGSDSKMVMYCIKKQSEAMHSVLRAPIDEISQACQEKWRADYEMSEHCIRSQTHARNQVSRRPKNAVYEMCTERWGMDYEMVEHCLRNS